MELHEGLHILCLTFQAVSCAENCHLPLCYPILNDCRAFFQRSDSLRPALNSPVERPSTDLEEGEASVQVRSAYQELCCRSAVWSCISYSHLALGSNSLREELFSLVNSWREFQSVTVGRCGGVVEFMVTRSCDGGNFIITG